MISTIQRNQPAAIRRGFDRRLFLTLGAAAAALPGSAFARTYPLSVRIDVTQAPELGSWAQIVARRVVSWWSIINNEISPAGYSPTNTVVLRFTTDLPDRLAGHTVGNVISLSAPYITAHPTYFNYVGHELVHVAQEDYRAPFSVWLEEGMADYVRYYILFPQDPERFFNPKTADYRRGYQPAAALLDYVERTKGIGSVKKVNAAMLKGDDGEQVLAQIAGEPLADVWAKVVAAFTDGSPAPQA